MVPKGWYVRLFLQQGGRAEDRPDDRRRAHGSRPTRQVLHVATGLPRLMYVTVDGCNGPRAYAGVVSSYFEKTTANFQRLTDMDWSTEIMSDAAGRRRLDGRAWSRS